MDVNYRTGALGTAIKLKLFVVDITFHVVRF